MGSFYLLIYSKSYLTDRDVKKIIAPFLENKIIDYIKDFNPHFFNLTEKYQTYPFKRIIDLILKKKVMTTSLTQKQDQINKGKKFIIPFAFIDLEKNWHESTIYEYNSDIPYNQRKKDWENKATDYYRTIPNDTWMRALLCDE